MIYRNRSNIFRPGKIVYLNSKGNGIADIFSPIMTGITIEKRSRHFFDNILQLRTGLTRRNRIAISGVVSGQSSS